MIFDPCHCTYHRICRNCYYIIEFIRTSFFEFFWICICHITCQISNNKFYFLFIFAFINYKIAFVVISVSREISDLIHYFSVYQNLDGFQTHCIINTVGCIYTLCVDNGIFQSCNTCDFRSSSVHMEQNLFVLIVCCLWAVSGCIFWCYGNLVYTIFCKIFFCDRILILIPSTASDRCLIINFRCHRIICICHRLTITQNFNICQKSVCIILSDYQIILDCWRLNIRSTILNQVNQLIIIHIYRTKSVYSKGCCCFCWMSCFVCHGNSHSINTICFCFFLKSIKASASTLTV